MGTKAAIWKNVGLSRSISHAKNNVKIGEILERAFDLVTLIRWIPSIQRILEKPKRSTPLMAKITNDLRKSISEKFSLNDMANRNKKGALIKLRANKIVSLATFFLASF